MPDQLAKPDAIASLAEHLIPRPTFFPGEDPALYDGLRMALLQDLAPRSPYERVLADNLITLEGGDAPPPPARRTDPGQGTRSHDRAV